MNITSEQKRSMMPALEFTACLIIDLDAPIVPQSGTEVYSVKKRTSHSQCMHGCYTGN
jgi:hypothetical protein